MDEIIWESKVRTNQIPICADFERNKLKAQEAEKIHKEKNKDGFNLKASSHHLEIGITYPMKHKKRNNYHPIGYNQDAFEFDRKCRNAYNDFQN